MSKYPETRRISHLHGSAPFTIPLNSNITSRRKISVLYLNKIGLIFLLPFQNQSLR